jgi:hypothetical protein
VSLPSYPWRIAVLVTACLGVALQDRLRRGPDSRRWREYLFLLLAGSAGAAFGGACDLLVTSRISPDYFTLGKGIPGGDGFQGRVLVLGLLAGSGPGALTGCFCLYVNSRPVPSPPLPWARLARLLAIPIAVAAACGLTIPFFASTIDPLGFLVILKRILTAEQAVRFLRVWWIHCSLYLGGLLGLVGSVIYIHRSRR